MRSKLLCDLSYEIRAPRSLLLRAAGKMLGATDCLAISCTSRLSIFSFKKDIV